MGPSWTQRGGKRTEWRLRVTWVGRGVRVPLAQASPIITLCLLLPGVLLDIQQHFGVKDRGAGLLQSGEARLPSWSPNLAFYLVGIPCPSLPWS